MKYLILLAAIVFGSWANAQMEDVVYEYQKGKKYIVHFVQNGNTLWRIQETYKVPAKDIIAANPGVEKGIVEGLRSLAVELMVKDSSRDRSCSFLQVPLKQNIPMVR